MKLIQEIIDTHTLPGVLGQLCFVALAMLIARCWRTGRRIPAPLCLATTLPAILGTVAAYLQLQQARIVMMVVEPDPFIPEAAARTIFGLLQIGIVSSGILLALCVLFSPRKKEAPARREARVGSLGEVQAVSS